MNLVSFYLDQAPDDRGRRLHDILAWDHEALEEHHDYIQELFPLRERSMFNPEAPILNDELISEFRTNPAIRNNLQRSLDTMLDFYGFRWNNERTTIVPGERFRERADQWLVHGDHNHLRITRILKCLTICGLENEAKAFLQALLLVADKSNVSDETLRFWRNAVQGKNP